MLKGLTRVTSQHGLGKRKSIVLLCKKLGERVAPNTSAIITTIGSGVLVYCVVENFKKGAKQQVEEVVGAIKDHEIYPKIYRLVNGNVDARKALGYRIDPRYWTTWEYAKSLGKTKVYEVYETVFGGSSVEAKFSTPLLRKFNLPCQGSRKNGVLQVWASRQKVDDGWELERMELSFSPRITPTPARGVNVNANALGNSERSQEDASEEVMDISPVDGLHLHDFQSETMITERDHGERSRKTIVIWVDSGVSPRAQLEDPSIELASLPNMDDPWKIQLDDFEEPAVDYINED